MLYCETISPPRTTWRGNPPSRYCTSPGWTTDFAGSKPNSVLIDTSVHLDSGYLNTQGLICLDLNTRCRFHLDFFFLFPGHIHWGMRRPVAAHAWYEERVTGIVVLGMPDPLVIRFAELHSQTEDQFQLVEHFGFFGRGQRDGVLREWVSISRVS